MLRVGRGVPVVLHIRIQPGALGPRRCSPLFGPLFVDLPGSDRAATGVYHQDPHPKLSVGFPPSNRRGPTVLRGETNGHSTDTTHLPAATRSAAESKRSLVHEIGSAMTAIRGNRGALRTEWAPTFCKT